MAELSKGEPIGGRPVGGERRFYHRCPIRTCKGTLYLQHDHWVCDTCKLQWDKATLHRLLRNRT